MLNKWCRKPWLYVMYTLGAVMAVILIVNWNRWDTAQKLLTAMAVVLPAHVYEEWQVPGGFHYSYNMLFGSEYPNRYPMNRLTDMITNFAGELFFIVLIIIGANTGMILALAIFSTLEVVIHTIVGAICYRKFKSKGKRSIYSPGLITAYIGFGVVGTLMFVWLSQNHISGSDWLVALGILAVMLIGMIAIPESLLKKKENEYAFATAGYFEKFLRIP